MAFHPNHSAKFRAALKGELPAWVEQGLVTEAGAQQLRAAYQLDALGKESSRLLTAVLFTIGSLLIGGGIISFVAAHWNEIAPGPKVAALFTVLLAFHLGGYWLHAAAQGCGVRRLRLGHDCGRHRLRKVFAEERGVGAMNKRTAAFALAVTAQVVLLIAVPAQKIYTRATQSQCAAQDASGRSL